jgi:hypothetical protein
MEIKKNTVVIKVYARDNLCSSYPSEQLIEISQKIKEIWENEGYEKAVELIEKIIEDESEEEEFEYEISKEGILIWNDKRDVWGSHGYEKVLIFEFPLKEIAEEAENWIDDEAGYILVERNDVKETSLEWIDDEHILYEDCIITADELRTIINKFVKTIEEELKYDSLIGTPIISNNPFAYGYDDWNIEIARNEIGLYVSAPVRVGAGYMMHGGRLIFKKDKEAKRTLEEVRELIKKHASYIQELLKELLEDEDNYEKIVEVVCDNLPPDFERFSCGLKKREIFLFLRDKTSCY